MVSYSSSSGNNPEPLTAREQEILLCLAEGLSNQEIAQRLYLAEKTVRWYNSQIYDKLGVANRQEAIEQARALDLVDTISDTPPVVGKHNLPAQATPFVGRRDELAELASLLTDPNTRLITILAPGGMGKTRLALEAARVQVGRYADGVYFVPLAPLSSANDIVTTIAENIGFSFYGSNPPAQQLADFLRERSLLLVLDNFEHLLDGAPLIGDLVQAALDIRLLTTSRERLNLRGETVYVLRGLEFSTWETPEDALEYEAVKLFLRSAQRVRPDFEIQADNLDYLARICRLTGGMPLGIELAAGWADVLSLEQIATELQHGLDILETEMRDVPERQRSLRATFGRTWERLTDDEQRVFMRLSVFRGGFTVDAARAVAETDVRALRKLANKALVQVSPEGRHDIHELLRQYGAEKLAASGEEGAIEEKHAAFFAEFMLERKQDIKTDRQLEALKLIDPEFENVRVAWLHNIDQKVWDALPKFLHSFWFYLDVRTRGQLGVELLEYAVKALRSLPASAVIELARGRVLARIGWFYNDIGAFGNAYATCEEAIHILRQHDSPDDLMAALHERQNTPDKLGQQDIDLSFTQEGLTIARKIGDIYWEGYLLLWAGYLRNNFQGDFVSARNFTEEALAVFETLGDDWGLQRTYHVLGEINLNQKDYETAKQWLRQQEPLAEAFGHIFSIANLHIIQASIALLERQYAAARLRLAKSLRRFWDSGYQYMAPYVLTHFARLFIEQNEFESVVEILGTLQKYPLMLWQVDQTAEALHSELQGKLEAERFAAAWARGQRRELSALVAELLADSADA
ncbi:MAG: LuxR C-terminal-related transcriptional regulator [Chloroflexota bacterium]